MKLFEIFPASFLRDSSEIIGDFLWVFYWNFTEIMGRVFQIFGNYWKFFRRISDEILRRFLPEISDEIFWKLLDNFLKDSQKILSDISDENPNDFRRILSEMFEKCLRWFRKTSIRSLHGESPIISEEFHWKSSGDFSNKFRSISSEIYGKMS